MADPRPSQSKREDVTIPPRPFFYTVDQICALLSLSQKYVESTLIHYDGRSIGIHKKDTMLAVNVAPIGKQPVWRVSETELLRFLQKKGIKFYERAWLS